MGAYIIMDDKTQKLHDLVTEHILEEHGRDVEIAMKIQELKEDVESLTNSVTLLVQMWQEARGIIAFIKWMSGIGGALVGSCQMSTSGSTVFNITRDQLIAGALRMVGAVAQGQSPTATQISEAAEALNMMVKAWEVDGMPLWGLTEYAVTLTASTNKYPIGIGKTINIPKPLKVIQAWTRETASGVDVPMRIVSKQEYNMLGNKTSSGTPIQIYYNPQLAFGDLYTFPTPDATVASAYKIHIVYQRPFEDFVATGDNPDFPQEWLDALKYGLAARLAPEYGVPLDQRNILNKEAKERKDEALSFGTEEGSLFFQVDRRGY
jgi:hypothetical protein